MTNFSKQTCMGMHKYVKVSCKIKMEAFSWMAQPFHGLGFFIFPHTCLLNDFVLRIICSSRAFSKYVFLFANNKKILSSKCIFFFPPLLTRNIVGPGFST